MLGHLERTLLSCSPTPLLRDKGAPCAFPGHQLPLKIWRETHYSEAEANT